MDTNNHHDTPEMGAAFDEAAFRIVRQISSSSLPFVFEELLEFSASGSICPGSCLEYLVQRYKDCGGELKDNTDILMSIDSAYMVEMCAKYSNLQNAKRWENIRIWERRGQNTVKIVRRTDNQGDPWEYAVVPASNPDYLILGVFSDEISARNYILDKGYFLTDETQARKGSKTGQFQLFPTSDFVDSNSIKAVKSFSFSIPLRKLANGTKASFEIPEHLLENSLHFWVDYEEWHSDNAEAEKDAPIHHLTATVWVDGVMHDFREYIDTVDLATAKPIPSEYHIGSIVNMIDNESWLTEKLSGFFSMFWDGQ